MYGFLGPSWVLITYNICPPRNRRERERRVRITINDGGGESQHFRFKSQHFRFSSNFIVSCQLALSWFQRFRANVFVFTNFQVVNVFGVRIVST